MPEVKLLHRTGCSYPLNWEGESYVSFITTGEKGEDSKKAHGTLAHKNSCLVKPSLNKTLT